VLIAAMPQSLLARFQGLTGREQLIQLLRFVCPLSVTSVIN
jgi:hypothetical protein